MVKPQPTELGTIQNSIDLLFTIQELRFTYRLRLSDILPSPVHIIYFVNMYICLFYTYSKTCNSPLDTYTERNRLMQETYPKLKQICQDKYGLEFQVLAYFKLVTQLY